MNITGGKYNRLNIEAPDANIVRPTLSKVRMAVFNTLFSMIEFEGKSFLDMYAGSGIIGLEALSRGFSDVVAIEKNLKVAEILKKNYKTVGESPKLYVGDSSKTLEKLNRHFDVIYIDPPYFADIYEKSLNSIKSADIVILEHVGKVDTQGWDIIKQKTYGDKTITFLEKHTTN